MRKIPLKIGDIISHSQMCSAENFSLQKGMNFGVRGSDRNIILMSQRKNAPYVDEVQAGGKVIIYEGHDIATSRGGRDPKQVDQPKNTKSGALTENGKFYEAVELGRETQSWARVRVYEKIQPNIWCFNGIFKLMDVEYVTSGSRKVFRFRLELIGEDVDDVVSSSQTLEHLRAIPSEVKREVWKRDGGKCCKCGATDNLHYDHILPFSKGGSSLLVENIQILCARHNLLKRDKIE